MLKYDCSTATLGESRDLTKSSGDQRATATEILYTSDSSDTECYNSNVSGQLTELESEVTPMMFCQVTESWKDI